MDTLYLNGPWKVDPIPSEEGQGDEGGLELGLPATLGALPFPLRAAVPRDGQLTQIRPYVGKALFTKECFLGDADTAVITLERTRNTRLWFDDTMVGSCDSLSVPHRYVLGRIKKGMHRIRILVSNDDLAVPGGHLTSDDTQTNWNGILGEIGISCGRCILIGKEIIPDTAAGTLLFRARFAGLCSEASVSIDGGTSTPVIPGEGSLEAVLPLEGSPALWDEFSPALHTLECRMDRETFSFRFGIRRFSSEGRILKVNGQETFLRGRHEALVFPNRDGLPTDRDFWHRYLSVIASYGLNHIRCHTCCPPEAAFVCADEIGMYIEPELPFWGTVRGPEDEGYDPKINVFLFREGLRILSEYGSHPSFILFSLGNELWGSKKVLREMLTEYKKRFPHILFTAGSNNFQFAPDILPEEDVFVGVRLGEHRLFRGSYAMCDSPQGIVQTTEPESASNYDRAVCPDLPVPSGARSLRTVRIQYGTGVKTVEAGDAEEIVPQIPVIAHEVGQYTFYPDFDEIGKYTGTLRPMNLERMAERIRAAGLWPDRRRFFSSAGKLAADCYRREIETLLRSSEISGFQLLDLQDYPGQGTALVGILNALMENKGIITPSEWKRFCSDEVILAEFPRFVYYSGESPSFVLRLSLYGPRKGTHRARCRLLDGGDIIFEKNVDLRASCRRLSLPAEVSVPPVEVKAAVKLLAEIALDDGAFQTWPLWFFPKRRIDISHAGIRSEYGFLPFRHEDGNAAPRGPHITGPPASGSIPCAYSSDFWCYPMFRSISRSMGKPEPAGTMGLCIDPEDPLLRGFPADDYTTPVWYRILACAHAQEIDDRKAPVQMIDNTERCRRLGILYRREGRVFLTARLWEDADAPAVNGLAHSLSRAILCTGLPSDESTAGNM